MVQSLKLPDFGNNATTDKCDEPVDDDIFKFKMSSRTSVVIGFIFGILLGSAFVIYLKLWTMDSTFSTQEAQILRKQFDLANMEAMDESAEWRMKYDMEVDRSKRFKTELEQVKKTLASVKLKLEKSHKYS
ncbi:hypothetical protein ZOSMA_88G00670 [Zostera marina]|uniref:Uncharacterized protein n=1 Tax=Zostera marina TaxID=29655 RepID=A0A0K9NME6_ZOSMR|nr:hypothetical protein ZOSMA_88G00670 [Zostera marina]